MERFVVSPQGVIFLTMGKIKVRHYQRKDCRQVREICCRTGFLGEPITKIFNDREIFADFFTRYYTEMEPESAFVAEDEGKIAGYVLGCCSKTKFREYLIKVFPMIFVKLIWRYFTTYSSQERRWVRKVLADGIKASLHNSPKAPHVHINVLKKYRGYGVGKALINRAFQYMRGKGVKKVYGGVWSFDDKKTRRVYTRLGFEICSCREVGIFKDILSERTFALQIARDLTKKGWQIK